MVLKFAFHVHQVYNTELILELGQLHLYLCGLISPPLQGQLQCSMRFDLKEHTYSRRSMNVHAPISLKRSRVSLRFFIQATIMMILSANIYIRSCTCELAWVSMQNPRLPVVGLEKPPQTPRCCFYSFSISLLRWHKRPQRLCVSPLPISHGKRNHVIKNVT